MLMAIAMTALLFIYPRAVATSISEVNHGLLTLIMLGVSSGFIHGVGFVPRMTVWRILFNPFIGWSLMAMGLMSTLSAL